MIGEGTWSCQIWLGMGGQGWGYVVEGHKGNGGERGGGLASLLLQTVFPRKLSSENILRTQTKECTNSICYRYHSPIASSLPFPGVASVGLFYSFPNLPFNWWIWGSMLSMIIWFAELILSSTVKPRFLKWGIWWPACCAGVQGNKGVGQPTIILIVFQQQVVLS